MISWEQYMDIKGLAAAGVSRREIARRTGHARDTIRKVLSGEHKMRVERRAQSSKLDPFKTHVQARFEAYGLSAVRLIEEIKPLGYSGSIATLRRYLKDLKGPVERLKRATVRFETPPGRQAQADWTECGRFDIGERRPLTVYAFVIVLAWSRFMYVRFTASTKLGELIACHQAAFAYFGGWTQEVLYDNMKQVRIGPGKLNEAFMDFAGHHGFGVKTHRPYRPRTKGKVERPVDYLKDNFLAGRSFASIDDLNAQVLHWLDNTANVRVHGTTGAVPKDRWREEGLIALDSVPLYRFHQPVPRIVSNEAVVHYRGSRYSVPPAFAGQRVDVSADGGILKIVAGETIVAEHRQAVRGGQLIVAREHLAELWKLTNVQTAAPRRDERERWHLTLNQTVERVSLSVYDKAAS